MHTRLFHPSKKNISRVSFCNASQIKKLSNIKWPPCATELQKMFEEFKHDYFSLRYLYENLLHMQKHNIEPMLVNGKGKNDPEFKKLSIELPDLRWKVLQRIEDMQDSHFLPITINSILHLTKDELSILLKEVEEIRPTLLPDSLEAVENKTEILAAKKLINQLALEKQESRPYFGGNRC